MESKLALLLGSGAHEVADAFRSHKINAFVAEGAPGKLARFGGPQAGHTAKRCQKGADDGQTAMHVKLGHILAREAFGPGKQKNQPVIEWFT